jgi:carbohydrate-binding DOMON domain-containing protein
MGKIVEFLTDKIFVNKSNNQIYVTIPRKKLPKNKVPKIISMKIEKFKEIE